jgi:hypothetical protein
VPFQAYTSPLNTSVAGRFISKEKLVRIGSKAGAVIVWRTFECSEDLKAQRSLECAPILWNRSQFENMMDLRRRRCFLLGTVRGENKPRPRGKDSIRVNYSNRLVLVRDKQSGSLRPGRISSNNANLPPGLMRGASRQAGEAADR